jgi:mannose-6-phosphate isomerase
MKQIPAFKDYLWGGERLVAEYGKRTGMRPVAESWELSCHPDGPSAIANGPLAGLTLAQAIKAHPEYVGDMAAPEYAGEFPVLVKLIDAKQKLSLQVHPDDAYARERENSLGKNEMWYVVDCEPGASLILGLSHAMGKAEIAAAIKSNAILGHANTVPVSPGDCFCVPAGMLHAIGAGIVIAEIQQNSNITYRVYDYGRAGADGKPRPLHVERAADVIDAGLSAANSSRGAPCRERGGCAETALADWRFFRVSRICVSAGADSPAAFSCGRDSFHSLLVLDGALELAWGDGAVACSAGVGTGVGMGGDAGAGASGGCDVGAGAGDSGGNGTGGRAGGSGNGNAAAGAEAGGSRDGGAGAVSSVYSGACAGAGASGGNGACVSAGENGAVGAGGAAGAAGAAIAAAAMAEAEAGGRLRAAKGECVFVPAGMGAYSLSGKATALLVTL